eukprot:COSAG02_NODE_9658_length_2150_cov_1.590931_4_plen_29_part_01
MEDGAQQRAESRDCYLNYFGVCVTTCLNR